MRSLKNVVLFFIYISFCNVFAFQEVLKEIKSNKDFNKVSLYLNLVYTSKDSINVLRNDGHLELLKDYESWAINNKTEKEILIAQTYIIKCLMRQGNDIEVIALSNQILKNKKIFEYKEVLKLLGALRNFYFRIEQYDELLKIYNLYCEQFDKHYPNIAIKPDRFKEFGLIYYGLKDYEKASGFFKERVKGLRLKKEKDYMQISSGENDIGLCFLNLKKLDSAEYYFDKAIIAFEKSPSKNPDKYFKNIIKANLASIYVAQKKYDNVLPYFLKELSLSKGRKDFFTLEHAYYKVANVYYLKNNTSKAIKYLDSTFFTLQKFQNNNLKEKALFLKAKVNFKARDFENAEIYFNNAQEYKDSINKVKIEKRYAYSAIKYEAKERQIELQESKQKNEIDSYVKFFQKIGIFVLVVLLIVLFLYLSKILKNKKLITTQRNLAEKTSKEREILLKEVHHRVKNNLQVISSILELQSLKNKDEKLTEVLQMAQHRIQAMSLIHQQLYRDSNNLNDVHFKEYVETLIAHIKASNTHVLSTIRFTVEALDYKFQISTAVTLGLIVNELITNAYKHAFVNKKNGNIFIGLTKIDTHQFCLIVKDNGIGFEEDLDKMDSLGLKLVRLLSKQLGGKMTCKSENGTEFIIDFRDDVAV